MRIPCGGTPVKRAQKRAQEEVMNDTLHVAPLYSGNGKGGKYTPKGKGDHKTKGRETFSHGGKHWLNHALLRTSHDEGAKGGKGGQFGGGGQS